ncbi:TRZ/ATZ family protein, partial [Candidatus Aerophobetes bacterium]
VGEEVLISGVIYTARDAAHKRLVDLIKKKKPLPFPLKDEIIYYTGPTPAKPPRPIGSCGPTTSFRMDSFTPLLLSKGLRGMIGKGSRSPEIIAFADLGLEAVYKLWVEDFPAIIGIDSRGEDLYNV